jgi:enoyl-[acyl-carrier-protein] reductase (NADH)
MEAVFAALKDKWGRIDILVHSIAFCPADDLHGRSPIVRAPDLRAPWTSRSIR